jgi:hypothetical protein
MICSAGNWSYRMFEGPGGFHCDYTVILERADEYHIMIPLTLITIMIAILIWYMLKESMKTPRNKEKDNEK